MKPLPKIKLVGYASPKNKFFTVHLTRFECVLLVCFLLMFGSWLLCVAKLTEYRSLLDKQLSTPTMVVKPAADTNLNFFDTP